jgi:hypothetical protein
MRALLILCAALMLCSCRGRKKSEPQFPGPTGAEGGAIWSGATPGGQKLIVTPEKALTGKVAFVNSTSRFVVLNFPIGHLPALEQRLNLYRGGLKVGEVKVTGPQYDDNIVADLVGGDSEVGDQVRDR